MPRVALSVIVPLPFPEFGLDRSPSFTLQRAKTTPVAQNVRVYEPSTDRARGGSRPGLVQLVPEQLPLS